MASKKNFWNCAYPLVVSYELDLTGALVMDLISSYKISVR